MGSRICIPQNQVVRIDNHLIVKYHNSTKRTTIPIFYDKLRKSQRVLKKKIQQRPQILIFYYFKFFLLN